MSAQAVTLETSSTALVGVVDTRTVKDLPMNGRDFRQMLKLAPGEEMHDAASVATTMAFVTFVFFQFFNILNARNDTTSVFHRSTLTNRWLWIALGAVVLLQVGVTHVGFLQSLFDTTDISVAQWAVCIAVASSVLWAEELRKFVVRTRLQRKEIPQ